MADLEKIDIFIQVNENKFAKEDLDKLRTLLTEMDDSTFTLAYEQRYRSPQTIWMVSFFFGAFGIDRYLIGDKKGALIKFITHGGANIWHVIDLFLIMNLTRKYNFGKVEALIKKDEDKDFE